MNAPGNTNPAQYDDINQLIAEHLSGDNYQASGTGTIKKLHPASGKTMRTFSNIGDLIDSLMQQNGTKIASIIDEHENLINTPGTPLLTKPTVKEIVHEIDTDAAKRDELVKAFLNDPTVTGTTVNGDKTKIQYTGGIIEIVDLIEQLYLLRKIEIGNLNQVAQKVAYAEKVRQTRQQAGQNTGSSSFGGNAPTALNVTPNDELNPYAIEAACQKAKASPGSAGYYGFDGKYFTIKYDKGTRSFTAEYQDKEGNKKTTTGPDSATIVTNILSLAKKEEAKKEIVELDMKDEFDEHDFHDFCDEVSKAKKHKGALTVHGHKFSVRDDHHGGYLLAFTDYRGKHRHEKGTKEKLGKMLTKEVHKLHEHSPAHNHAETPGGHEKHEAKEGKKEHGDKAKDEKKEHAETEGHEKPHSKEEKKTHVGFFGKMRDSIKETLKVLWTPVPGVAKAGLRSGIVGGVLLGTSAVLSSAAIASAIVPAMSMTFLGSSAWSLIKWIKNRGKKEEAGDDKAGHAHGGGH